ncbi:MAG TPA: hypothetical protein VEI97_20255, partial [bacterium]|nr:hypothetical protein [bacterium]
QQDRLVQGAAAAPDQVAVDPATGVLTPLPPLGSDALSALPQVTGGASTGFLLLTNVLEPPAGVAIAAIRVPQPVPAGVRLELTLRRLLPRLLANRPPLFARRPQRRQGMLDGLQLDDVHAVLGPKPPSGAMPPTAPMGDDLSTAVLGTIYNTGMPLQLHAVDGRTALVSQIVAPVPSLGHHVGILRLGALTPPSAAIDWLGYLPLPASIGDVPGNVHVDLFATPDAWLVGLTRVPYPTADPERGDWSATFYAGERHWARVPYPAGWTPRGEGRLGYTAPAGLLDRPWTEG